MTWLSYGLGTSNATLPAFVVLVSKDAARDQPLYSRLWGPGFLPSEHQGVQFRAGREPVLFLANPEGVSVEARRELEEQFAWTNGRRPLVSACSPIAMDDAPGRVQGARARAPWHWNPAFHLA